MPDYWVIVRRGRSDLLELLTRAFHERSGFTVVEDRRDRSRTPRHDRRLKAPEWDRSDFFVAERLGALD